MKVLAEKLGKYSKMVVNQNSRVNPTGYSNILEQKVKRIATLDFSSERKCMSTIVKDYEGISGNTVLLKGAPERVIAKCSHYLNCHNVQKALSE